jgi:hypothetical protein
MFPGLAKILWNLLFGFALQIVGYLLMAQPKGPKPDEVKDLEAPKAEAGMPIPVPFGDITIKGVNYLYTGEKETILRKVS